METCTIVYNGERLSGQAGLPLIDFLELHGKNCRMSVITPL